MNNENLVLSEPHNFGRVVTKLPDGRIFKPRSIFWERLILGNSRFRQCLDSCSDAGNYSTPHFALPRLRFENGSDAWSGTVECLKLSPIESLGAPEAFMIGSTVGLFAWLGISDLHRENVMMGLSQDGQFVFTTVDIETIMDRFQTLGHSGLVPDMFVPAHVSGISVVFDSFRNTQDTELYAAVCAGFLVAMESLNRARQNIEEVFCSELSLDQSPVRVVLRKTKAYVNYLNDQLKARDFEIPPLPSELEQLKRRDVPYFFRFPKDPDDIYFFRGPDDFQKADLGKDYEKMRLLDRRKFGSEGCELISQSELEKFISIGVLQLARSLVRDATDQSFESQFGSTFLVVKNKRIFLRSNNGLALTCQLS